MSHGTSDNPPGVGLDDAFGALADEHPPAHQTGVRHVRVRAVERRDDLVHRPNLQVAYAGPQRFHYERCCQRSGGQTWESVSY